MSKPRYYFDDYQTGYHVNVMDAEGFQVAVDIFSPLTIAECDAEDDAIRICAALNGYERLRTAVERYYDCAMEFGAEAPAACGEYLDALMALAAEVTA